MEIPINEMPKELRKNYKTNNMNDKQKEIEEIKKMQKEIFDSCAWRFGKPEEDYREIANDIGEDLYDLGYRKIDKDSVVLSREEYEKLAEPRVLRLKK